MYNNSFAVNHWNAYNVNNSSKKICLNILRFEVKTEDAWDESDP